MTPGTALARHGLRVVGGFHPSPADRVPPGTGTLLLIGPGEGLWRAFSAAPEAHDGQPHPLDRWSKRVLNALAEGLGGSALFPFGGPSWHPFQHWAARGEAARPSPVRMQVSASRGLWLSYRGALAFPERRPLPVATAGADPCRGCPAPCLSACPVDAFRGGVYDVAACVAHVASPAGAACRDGCLVRRACPAGRAAEPPRPQRRFHMAAFLKAQGAPADGTP